MVVELCEHEYFVYIRELEYMATVAGMVGENLDGHLCRELYDEEFIKKIKQNYREIIEIINSLKIGGFEFIEFLMSYKKPFTLEDYKQFILDMPLVDYVYHFFGYSVTREEIAEALEDEEALSKLYEERRFYVSSYVNLKLIIYQREHVVNKYFDCVQAIRTPELEQYLDECEERLPILRDKMLAMSKEKSAVELSEYILKKTYIDDIRYDNYAFIPVFMLPRNNVIYYAENTMILYSETRVSGQEEALCMLKTMADHTRIRIIDLLAERERENGKNLARCLQLAPSTVSHHMEQLVQCGLVKEEKDRNAKYYSIQHENAERLIELLGGILLKNYKN